MATTPRFVAELSPACGIHPATFDRYMRTLRAAGMIPRSGHGGGVAGVHLDHNHASAIILSLAAPTHVGAADAVRACENLYLEGYDTPLKGCIAAKLTSIAAAILSGGKPERPADTGNWRLTICLDPLDVWQSWTTHDGREILEHFADRQAAHPPQKLHTGVRRQTIITAAVLNAAANLCADTIKREGVWRVAPDGSWQFATGHETAGSAPTEPAALNTRQGTNQQDAPNHDPRNPAHTSLRRIA